MDNTDYLTDPTAYTAFRAARIEAAEVGASLSTAYKAVRRCQKTLTERR